MKTNTVTGLIIAGGLAAVGALIVNKLIHDLHAKAAAPKAASADVIARQILAPIYAPDGLYNMLTNPVNMTPGQAAQYYFGG